MLQILAQDIINDVTLLKTDHKGHLFNVRYGLQIRAWNSLENALADFHECQQHALNCKGFTL
ncbi:hypothetical protein vBRpoPV14_11 [Ruegeria phage vB_RpoP-V14]|uniref:Uncharacterized protein n=4 Tax=Aorunvirus V12 TaxID=2846074 RepID=A0A2Z4QFE9_9CAUD|nr:hypothetical protein HYP62_gp10 [Ruegeria phage vB_RpoP-V12]AWY08797.1 hypothetical protein vBRpoPV12_10 [Ruegeria phage vB_RpoP-V12]AWY08968.1 hypothetical protein vBRpoPV21_10 [Ruegeria phage vB_RpoP-V21]AWY09529.1 hypothetical protein vBRpoPV17_10 [Ruegeria phage vB_RpoP-V17]AXF42129.1 hypothetical protein vBRpoPV14_11 [Ruegeria phage vB_RpoP-V14]